MRLGLLLSVVPFVFGALSAGGPLRTAGDLCRWHFDDLRNPCSEVRHRVDGEIS